MGRRPRAVRPSWVLGLPVLPPGRATLAVNRLRSGLARLRRAIGPPPIHILESLFGLLDHSALVALCELGVPDALARPMTVRELARRVGADEVRLERLVRYSASRGWLVLGRRGTVRPNRATRFLRADHPGGWREWVEFAGGHEVQGAMRSLGASIRADGGADAFELANGASFFDWMADHTDRSATFDGAMAAGARMHGLALAAAYDWPRAGRVCDVGGGTGEVLRALLDRFDHLEGVLFDLPQVAPAGTHPRLHHVSGDAFEAVPGGCDTYLFVNVLHDWADADCTRLLRTVARDAPAGSTVIVVEAERSARPTLDISASEDLLMLALTAGGRERSTAEFAALAERSGLRPEATHVLASGDRAHVLRTPAPST